MSASLVGSEMCIRDRYKVRRALRSRARQPTPAALPLLGRWLKQAREVAPVSYTHLTLPTICSV
eukprot:7090053-Alexandrium_andersonii.AAC.1